MAGQKPFLPDVMWPISKCVMRRVQIPTDTSNKSLVQSAGKTNTKLSVKIEDKNYQDVCKTPRTGRIWGSLRIAPSFPVIAITFKLQLNFVIPYF